MLDRIRSLVWQATLVLLALVLFTSDAQAYAGPVPGPEFIGYFMSLLVWLGVVFSSLLVWPVYALRRLFSRGSAAPQEPADCVKIED